MPVSQIAEGMNMSTSTVSSILKKYKKAFQPVVHRASTAPEIDLRRLDHLIKLQKKALEQ